VGKKIKKSFYEPNRKGYGSEFSEDFKKEIRRRDKYCCAICNEKTLIDVHHIDYIKAHTTRLNCICLCRKHHYEVHRSGFIGRVEWKYKLWRIAGERERNEIGTKTVI
jgi:hypothetical protein